MHELSLVKNILDTLNHEFPDKYIHIRKIYLSVGILSNVQPILMKSAFDAMKKEVPEYRNASISIDVIPLRVHCKECDKVSEIENYAFKCKFCKAPCNNVIQGDELLITKVEFEEN